MPFPDSSKVIYKRNPLDKVICQLRFPAILKIETDIPANFQEKIRSEFPVYNENMEVNLNFPPMMENLIPDELLKQNLQIPQLKNHEFSSEDGECKINLTRNFISLSVSKYSRWDDFKQKLLKPIDALIEIYNPAYYTRIGLRYIDVIRRSALDLDDVAWSELLQPHILGMLSSSEIQKNILIFENKYEIKLSDNKSISRIITKFVETLDDTEKCYSIDTDFFNNSKIEIDKAIEILDYFSIRGARLIRWCITDRLYNAMEPVKP